MKLCAPLLRRGWLGDAGRRWAGDRNKLPRWRGDQRRGGRLPRRCLSCDPRGVTEAEAREVIRSRVREVFAREPVRGFLLGLQVGAAVVWVARAEVEGDTFARRVAVILRRWGLAA